MKTGERGMVLESVFSAERPLKSEVLVMPEALHRLNELGVFTGLRRDSRHLLLTDNNVKKLYLSAVRDSLEGAGYSVRTLVVTPHERSKTIPVYTDLVKKALRARIDKHSVVVSLGGGLVSNLAGFLASTLYRGIGLIHIPTSLLAQVDAAIDFKQALNCEHGKNLVGSFYPADKIIVDPLVLRTLSRRSIRNGLAEVIKHALCQDRTFFALVNSSRDHITDLDFLTEVVSTSIRLKLSVMGSPLGSNYDEMVKQYGHSIGHAIEHMSGGRLYHGEAIAIGMCVSAEIGQVLEVVDSDTVGQHYSSLRKIGLPTSVSAHYPSRSIWDQLRYDKHFFSKGAYVGLLKEVGIMARTPEGTYSHRASRETVLRAIKMNRRN
jgi:3-dehydroquinate synthase